MASPFVLGTVLSEKQRLQKMVQNAMSLKTEVFYVSKSCTTYQHVFLHKSLKGILQAVRWPNL